MSRSKLPKLFHLKRNNELLAVLESCGPSWEMFWLSCDFKPTALFTDVEPLFQEASSLEDMDMFEKIYDNLEKMDVVLIDIENRIEIKYFVLHVDGNTVPLRYAEPPYMDE